MRTDCLKSTRMTFAHGIRSVRFSGFSVAFMLLSTCSCSDHPHIEVIAIVGEAATLPCMCPPDWPPFLVWQKNIDEALVVNYYKDDDQEDIQIALEYRNRTELRLTGNCSLVIHSVCLSDQGLYICYYKKNPLRHEKIYLGVTEQGKVSDEPKRVQSTTVISSVCGVLIILLITIAAAYIGITCRNRHQIRTSETDIRAELKEDVWVKLSGEQSVSPAQEELLVPETNKEPDMIVVFCQNSSSQGRCA